MTNHYEKKLATTLLRAGAADFIELPLDLELLTHRIEALTLRARSSVSVSARRRASAETDIDDPLGDFVVADVEDLMGQVCRIAPQDVTILLTGETGTGKNVLARAIHDLSGRRDEPFGLVDCTTLSPSVIESELFGHVKGAFTGADRSHIGKLAATGSGTLLFDEVNSLPLEMQSKLLRVVESRCFEPVGAVQPSQLQARLIAASNISLTDAVAAGQFRSDLYYRLNVVEFYMPPLRERRNAIGPLAIRFLEAYAQRNKVPVERFRPEVLALLEEYDWPGNIRELRNIVERAAAVCDGKEVGLSDLPPALRESVCPPRSLRVASLPLYKSREDAEKQLIAQALRDFGNNRKRVSEELGISRKGLYQKLHKYGFIEPTKAAPAILHTTDKKAGII